MPVSSRSVLKRQRQEVKRTARNHAVRSGVKNAIKKARVAVMENTPEYTVQLAAAIRLIDKACAKGVIHKNNAARKKSRLSRMAKKLTAQIKDS